MSTRDEELALAKARLKTIAKLHGQEANFVNCRVCERPWPCQTYNTAKPASEAEPDE